MGIPTARLLAATLVLAIAAQGIDAAVVPAHPTSSTREAGDPGPNMPLDFITDGDPYTFFSFDSTREHSVVFDFGSCSMVDTFSVLSTIVGPPDTVTAFFSNSADAVGSDLAAAAAAWWQPSDTSRCTIDFLSQDPTEIEYHGPMRQSKPINVYARYVKVVFSTSSKAPSTRPNLLWVEEVEFQGIANGISSTLCTSSGPSTRLEPPEGASAYDNVEIDRYDSVNGTQICEDQSSSVLVNRHPALFQTYCHAGADSGLREALDVQFMALRLPLFRADRAGVCSRRPWLCDDDPSVVRPPRELAEPATISALELALPPLPPVLPAGQTRRQSLWAAAGFQPAVGLGAEANPNAESEQAEMRSWIGNLTATEKNEFAVVFSPAVVQEGTGWAAVRELFGSGAFQSFLAPSTYIVRATPETAAAVAQDGRVEAMLPMTPGFRLRKFPNTTECASELRIDCDTLIVKLSTSITDLNETMAIAAKWTRDMVALHVMSASSTSLKVTSVQRITVSRVAGYRFNRTDILRYVSLQPDVLSVRPRTRWQQYGIIANRAALGSWDSGLLAERWRSSVLDGAGQIAMVGDTGLHTSSCMFKDDTKSVPIDSVDLSHRKVISYQAYADSKIQTDGADHGTHCSGILTGFLAHPTRAHHEADNGVAPASKLYFFDIGREDGSFSLPTDVKDYFQGSIDAGARVSSNSWGATVNKYSDDAADTDKFIFENPDYLVLFAAGNSGEKGLNSGGTPGTAKNVVTVGSVTGAAPNALSSFSSRGGAGPENRIKPDIVAVGDPVWATSSEHTCQVTTMSGTSMACPLAAGMAVLMRQYLTEGYYPSGIKRPADAFTPRASLLKAMLVNSAVPVSKIHRGDDGCTIDLGRVPSMYQGHGRAQLDRILKLDGDTTGSITGLQLFNKEVLAAGASKTFPLNFDPPVGGNLRITLVWTDPPGTADGNKALVNDLDLRVDISGGARVYPNGLQAADNINNVEQIVISPSAGMVGASFTITVTASTVAVGANQEFSLVIAAGQDPVVARPCTEEVCGDISPTSREDNPANPDGVGTAWDCWLHANYQAGRYEVNCPQCTLTYAFTAGDWGPCVNGQQHRVINCTDSSFDPYVYPMDHPKCSGLSRANLPATTRACSVPAAWQSGVWGACSVQCGNGYRGRSVLCVREGQTVAESECAGAKPASQQACSMGACATAPSPESSTCTSPPCGSPPSPATAHPSSDPVLHQPSPAPENSVMTPPVTAIPSALSPSLAPAPRGREPPANDGGGGDADSGSGLENSDSDTSGGRPDGSGDGSEDKQKGDGDAPPDTTGIVVGIVATCFVLVVFGIAAFLIVAIRRREKEKSRPSSMPPGWSRRFDADSNAFYYVDKKTGTTQWEHPNPEGVVVALTESNPMHSRNETQLPAGWERSYTEDGDKYYVNEAEGESSWEPPAGSTRGGGAKHSRDETQLPAGWEKNWTEDGDKFYANEHSGESSWEPPRGSTGGSAGPAL